MRSADGDRDSRRGTKNTILSGGLHPKSTADGCTESSGFLGGKRLVFFERQEKEGERKRKIWKECLLTEPKILVQRELVPSGILGPVTVWERIDFAEYTK